VGLVSTSREPPEKEVKHGRDLASNGSKTAGGIDRIGRFHGVGPPCVRFGRVVSDEVTLGRPGESRAFFRFLQQKQTFVSTSEAYALGRFSAIAPFVKSRTYTNQVIENKGLLTFFAALLFSKNPNF
jgi:hypothetical protein